MFIIEKITQLCGFLINKLDRYKSKRFSDFEDDNDEEEIIFQKDEEKCCECNLCYTFRNIIDFVTNPFRKYKNI
jgi:hypothetical protein